MDITVWDYYTKQKDGSFVWEFNHIEDGWNEELKFPTVKCPTPVQKHNFSTGKWRKSKAELIDGKVCPVSSVD